ncbi:MAG: hypothetical protein K0Q55_2646 [Verrucomicrobia bacterium]|jgi:hypothetical protein|nr:hypothetical protein [Verrucomicrobiota bacterium]
MKSISFLKISASLVAFAAMVATSGVQAATPNKPELGKAEVKQVVGQANVKAGDSITEGQTITTGPESGVEIWLGENGQLLRISENSSVTVEELKLIKDGGNTDAITTLNLKQGGLVGDVKKLSSASKYNVKHAQGVAGIRGTAYAILPGQGVVCNSGTVLVTFTVGGVASAPITLGPNQVALPPSTPGGPPTIVQVSPQVAGILATIAERFQNRRGGPQGGPRGGRDIQVVVSAFSGEQNATGTPPPHHPNND